MALKLVAILLYYSLAVTCNGELLFSSLSRPLHVTSSLPSLGQDFKAGEDQITIRWGLNQSSRIDDSTYKTTKVKLCYAPISQEDRPWRQTEDDLSRDKTCTYHVTSKPYSPQNTTFTWTIAKDVPSATYFVRVYVFNQDDNEVGYGQTTDALKTTNLFSVRAISGRDTSIDVAATVFSCFSVVSLAIFHYREKRKAKKSTLQAS